MNLLFVRKALALLALAAVAACSNGGGTSSIPAGGGGGKPPPSSLLARIVGVGDSLTAGYQAGGFLGATGFKDPLYPGIEVRPGQENGFWAYLYEQASGLAIPTAIGHMYDPSVSPLPLIAAPGLNNQLVPSLPPPINFEKPGNACTDYGGFDAAGYTLHGNQRVRMNPASTTVRNVAVPGMTLHEANTLTQPQSMSCKPLPGIQGLLAQVVDGESSTYWPVLGNWQFLGSRLTMVNAAAQLKPTLATVWLGANDALKYMGSGGQFHGGDMTAGQAASDLHQTIKTLTAAGARVVVANLPNILHLPYFMRVTIPKNHAQACAVQTYAACVMGAAIGFSFGGYKTGVALTTQMAKAYHLGTPGGCTPASTTQPCGYLTLQGTLTALQYWGTHGGKLPDLDNGHPGSGLGTYYITPAFAAKVQTLNNNLNDGIAMAAQATSTPLVDVATIFGGIASGNPSDPYFQQAVSIGSASAPCCTLAYDAGLVSFDGLHPSNTGYALVAYYFIKTVNQAYAAHIPQVDVRAAYAGTRCSDPEQCFPDEYAPPFNGALRPRVAGRDVPGR
ncbi:MAG: SGNH/GDSL hydrolase family protein [Candidatus Tumulicola sp.]